MSSRWGLRGGFVLFVMVSLLGCTAATLPAPHAKREISTATNPRVLETYGKLPLTFEANQGQTDSQVRFLARGRGYTVFLTPTEAVLALREPRTQAQPDRSQISMLAPLDGRAPVKTRGTVLRMRLVGANPAPQVTGLGELPGKVNSFISNDPTRWRTNIPTYAKVEYQRVYPGVNLVYYGNQRQLEYDFVVSPGADPGVITLAFEGMDGVGIDALGDLVFRADTGELRLRKPVVYQDHDGQRTLVPTKYVIKGERQVAFEVAVYDTTRPLVIDPVLVYSTFLGGLESDAGHDIAVDGGGNAYVTGFTAFSTDFPTTPGAFQATLSGVSDAFVTKLDPTGSRLVYSTYLGGGGGFEGGMDIAVDDAGNAYVAGITDSTDFPTTPGAFQTTLAGGLIDAFVVKLNSTGSALLYSTYLGGSAVEFNQDIAVDRLGNAYVTGFTRSTDFPTTPGAFQTNYAARVNTAFVTKLNATGSALVYSTYLGGSDLDEGLGIAVDAVGNAYVTGLTGSTDFPTTPGAFQATPSSAGTGGGDAFVTKLNATGSGLVYSTYLGGSRSDRGRGIAVDAAGDAYVTGDTDPADFPTTPGAFDTTANGGSDAFVTKLNATGSALVYSTYLGGSSLDLGDGIAVDAAGNAHVIGETRPPPEGEGGGTPSPDFPTTPGAFQPTFGGGFSDAFVTKLNATGSALVYSTYLGGSSLDRGVGIAVDAAGSAYVTGETFGPDFPTTPGVFQTSIAGGGDAFVTKLSFVNTPTGANVTVQLGQVTVTFTNVDRAGDTTLTTSATGPAPPAGFRLGTPVIYYDLTTTARFSAVTICINYAGIAFVEGSVLKLFHFLSGQWVDETISLDPVNTVICAATTSLSPFAVLEPANRLPVANAGADRMVECSGHASTPVTLNGSGSNDPDGDPLTYTWRESGSLIAGPSPTPTSQVSLGLGSHTVELTVADGKGGVARDEVTVTVQDTTPPQVTARLERIPRRDDHDDERDAKSGWTLFRVVASATDRCHSSPGVQANINSVTVTNGQLVRLRLDDDTETVRFRNGLLWIKAPLITLSVKATDSSGSTATAMVKLEAERERREHGERAEHKPEKEGGDGGTLRRERR